MKKISFILTFLLIVSSVFCVPAISFAADGDVVLFSYDGSATTELNAKNVSSGTEITDEKLTIKSNATLGDSWNSEQAPQKNENDPAVHINFTKTAASKTALSGTNSAMLMFNYADLIGNNKNYKYLTYEFDVYFGNDTSSASVRFTGMVNKPYSAEILASENALGYSGNLQSYNKCAVYTQTGTNEWHKVRCVFPISGGETLKLYIDDMDKTVTETKSAVDATEFANGFDISTSPQDAAALRSAMCFSIPQGTITQDVYIDNVKVTVGNDTVDTDVTKPTLSSANSKLTVGTASVSFTGNMTAENILNGINTDAAFKKIYQSDLTTERTGNAADGDILVLGGANGIYSYYVLEKAEAVSLIQEVTGTFATTGSMTYDRVDNIENGFKLSTKFKDYNNTASAKFNLPKAIDLSKLGDVFTISFDYKFEKSAAWADKDSIKLSGNNNYYLSQIFFNDKQFMQIFGGANGICVPTNTGAHNGTILGQGYIVDNDRIAGMELGKTYNVQLIVNKKTNKVHCAIDGEIIKAYKSGVASEFVTTVPAVFNETKLTTVKVTGRGGDGTNAIVEPTFSNFRAMPGADGLIFVNGGIAISNAKATVSYTSHNLNSEKTVKVIVAAYKGDSLLAAKIASATAPVGTNDSTLEVDFVGMDLTNAAYKIFFLDDFNNLKPYSSNAELEIQ